MDRDRLLLGHLQGRAPPTTTARCLPRPPPMASTSIIAGSPTSTGPRGESTRVVEVRNQSLSPCVCSLLTPRPPLPSCHSAYSSTGLCRWSHPCRLPSNIPGRTTLNGRSRRAIAGPIGLCSSGLKVVLPHPRSNLPPGRCALTQARTPGHHGRARSRWRHSSTSLSSSASARTPSIVRHLLVKRRPGR